MGVIKRGCADKNNEINRNIKISDKIGTASVYAQAYKACYPINCKFLISMKKIPLGKKDMKFVKKPFSKESLSKSMAFSEIAILRMVNFLSVKGICPFLPVVFRYYICPRDKYIMIANELADGDLKKLIINVKPSIKTLKIIYFQIFIGIYSIRKYFNIHHNDLHWGNVLYHNTGNSKKGMTYVRYIINKQPVLVPEIGIFTALWDFGLSYIPGKIKNKIPSKDKTTEWEDYKRIASMLMKDEDQTIQEYENLYVWFLNKMSQFQKPEDFIINYGRSLMPHETFNKPFIVKTFNLDKKIKTNDPFIKKYTLM